MAGSVGRNRLATDLDTIADILLRRRTTIRSLAFAVGMCKSTVHNWVKRGILRSHSNAIKPTLNEANKRQRLMFCLDQVEASSVPSNPTFKSLKNVLHIDEKWFFMTKTSQKYYLTEDEEPYRTCQSKRFITKIMFLGVVGRPVFSDDGEVLWDGKVGIFPLVESVEAKRKSKIGRQVLWKPNQCAVLQKKCLKTCCCTRSYLPYKKSGHTFYPRKLLSNKIMIGHTFLGMI